MRGRVRLHAVKMRASGGVEADDERRKSLAENSADVPVKGTRTASTCTARVSLGVKGSPGGSPGGR